MKIKWFKKNKEFLEIFKKNNYIKSNIYTILYKNNNNLLIGITYSKNFGKPFIKNKTKRQIKSILNINLINKNINKKILIIVKKRFLLNKYNENSNKLISLLLNINNK